jgi:hypothetical protein
MPDQNDGASDPDPSEVIHADAAESAHGRRWIDWQSGLPGQGGTKAVLIVACGERRLADGRVTPQPSVT